MPRAPRWMRVRLGVRVASALAAALVIAVTAALSSIVLVLLVRQSLSANIEVTASDRVHQLADRVAQNDRGAPNDNAFNTVKNVATRDDFAQVLVIYPMGDGQPPRITAEGGTDSTPKGDPMTSLLPTGTDVNVVPSTYITTADGDRVHVVLASMATTSVGSDAVAIFAVPLSSVDTAVSTLKFYLLFGVPLLIIVAGATTYLFAGRALRPVEAIRVQVAAMTEKDLAQRVPVPESHDEVGRLAETMNAMIGRLENAQGVQRRFVADASHELRSPLATISAGLELLQDESADPVTVGALRKETSRLGKLVDALLLLARADERGLQPRREEVDLDEIAEAERVRPGGEGVPIEVRAEPVRVIGDRGQLVRVLRNLVDNARRHARSQVGVTVARDGDFALIEVSDDGAGVPESDRARIFERFVRLDDARARADGGSGLGLAIVAEVVAAHGGTVEVREAPAGGALFRVSLPAAPQFEHGDVELSYPGLPAVVPSAESAPEPAPPALSQAEAAEAAEAAEPATAEPATAEPATAEPATAEPATAEPATAEPATAEPATAEPATAEPATVQLEAGGPEIAEPAASTAPTSASDAAQQGVPVPGRPADPPDEPTAPYAVPPGASRPQPLAANTVQPLPANAVRPRPGPTGTPPAGYGRVPPVTPPTGVPRQQRRPRPAPTPPYGSPPIPPASGWQVAPRPYAGPSVSQSVSPPTAPNPVQPVRAGRSPWLQAPVTDAEAKVDPPTAPWRIPSTMTDTDPEGIPAVRSDQPGSTIR
ncbi:ATP-binding protein [Pseudonocardia sp. GCM10023141]|uniref:ATP-binding protein n=1 Tax=Pseudonocardia sp. GCM10023141 TaxID=3252653 RepID=UPI00360C2625